MLNIGPSGWRWMLGSSAIPAIILVFGRWGTPESPRWLLKKGHTEKALAVVKQVYGPEAELSQLEEDTSAPTRIGKLFDSGYFKRTCIDEIPDEAENKVINIKEYKRPVRKKYNRETIFDIIKHHLLMSNFSNYFIDMYLEL